MRRRLLALASSAFVLGSLMAPAAEATVTATKYYVTTLGGCSNGDIRGQFGSYCTIFDVPDGQRYVRITISDAAVQHVSAAYTFWGQETPGSSFGGATFCGPTVTARIPRGARLLEVNMALMTDAVFPLIGYNAFLPGCDGSPTVGTMTAEFSTRPRDLS